MERLRMHKKLLLFLCYAFCHQIPLPIYPLFNNDLLSSLEEKSSNRALQGESEEWHVIIDIKLILAKYSI